MTRITRANPHRVAEFAHADEPALAALELARFVRPEVDVLRCVARLDDIARGVQGDTHLALRRRISIAEGFGGNFDDYASLDNSMLDRVLESRRGIPITLSMVWMEVGRRAGIEVQGVGLPGHFLVYAGGQLCDPFHYGEAIGFDEAAALVAGALGGPPRLDRSWLEPVSTPEVIRRMCRNLETRYLELGDPFGVEWVSSCLDALA